MLHGYRRVEVGNDRYGSRTLCAGHHFLWASRRDVASPRNGNSLQVGVLFLQAQGRYRVGRAVNAHVGDLSQPVPDFSVGGDDIELQTCLFKCGDEGHMERPA